MRAEALEKQFSLPSEPSVENTREAFSFLSESRVPHFLNRFVNLGFLRPRIQEREEKSKNGISLHSRFTLDEPKHSLSGFDVRVEDSGRIRIEGERFSGTTVLTEKDWKDTKIVEKALYKAMSNPREYEAKTVSL